MNQQDLIDAISNETGIKKTDVLSVLKVQGDVVKAALTIEGQEVVLHGIGKLKTVAKPARTGRNPKTGESMEIPAKTAVKLVVAKALKDAVA